MKKIVGLLVFMFASAVAQTTKPITLEILFKTPTFQQRFVRGLTPLNDGKSYASIVRDPKSGLLQVVQTSYSNAQDVRVLYTQQDLIRKADTLSPGTDFSSDERKVLIEQDEEQIYRRSTKANYFVYDLDRKTIVPVSDNGKQQFASFSPDGTKVAFVRENNIFIKNLQTGQEKQITTDGLKNEIINGWADWVYEEEFSFAKAFFWSPDSKRIAYYKFNEIEVPLYSMTIYQSPYPQQYTYKYPKAGEKNALVSIHMYALEDEKTIRLNTGNEKDQYIPRIKWTADPLSLCVVRMNRHQNQVDYLLANATDGSTKLLFNERDKYYVDIEKECLSFLADRKHFINVSERDGYNHLYLYNLQGEIVRQLTKGNWEVTKFYGVDENTGKVYYQSTEQSPLKRDVYSISLKGDTKQRLSPLSGTNSAEFSSDYSFYIVTNSSINSPSYISVYNQAGKEIRVIEDNSLLKKRLNEYRRSPSEFFSFKTTEGVELNGFIIKPDDFNPKKRYPVLQFVYGGPNSQEVADEWGGGRHVWFKMLAQKGYIVACVDNRGTGFRGAEFAKCTYKRLGKLETADQIETAKWLARQPYVDASRLGIWGWSFGGYMASLCATKGNGIFKIAIAVAPVTTWRFYDTIYAERFLQTPQENPQGYDEHSPIKLADQLQGKFLLVHGTADDNVHFQNSVLFSKALIQANKAFEQAYYPNQDHSIRGGNTSLHLYTRLSNFIINNL